MVQTVEKTNQFVGEALTLAIPKNVKPVVTRSQFKLVAAANHHLQLEPQYNCV